MVFNQVNNFYGYTNALCTNQPIQVPINLQILAGSYRTAFLMYTIQRMEQ